MKPESVSKPRKDKRVRDKIWGLSLYVTDGSYNSVKAFTNLKKICHEHLRDKCRIDVIDIESNPQLAQKNQIIAIPTLERTFPLPVLRVIGDLSNTKRVIAGLDLPR